MYEESGMGEKPPLNRRDFLRLGGVVGAATIAAACGPIAVPGKQTTSGSAQRGEVAVRIAHITDMHIEPYGPGTDGFDTGPAATCTPRARSGLRSQYRRLHHGLS